MGRVLLASVTLAALSLLLPSEPSYDPWAWIVWGREVLGLELDTTGGPSWKPGPVLLTTVFAPLGEGVAPALWLVVARAGGVLALVLAFRLGRRLGGGTAAGVVAVVALFTLPLWLRYLAHGNEAPLAIALMLWAVERHLDGRRDHTLVLLFAACLLRPEVFPFMAGVAVLLWRAEPARRPLIAGLLAALPLLWLVPEWIGSGNPLDAGKQAASEPWWSLSNAEVPWLAALERAHSLAGLPLELAALAGVAAAALRRERATLVLAGIGIAWLLLILVMTQLGFSGANRYFLAPLVVTCLLAGVGVGAAIGAPVPLPARAAVAAALVALLVPFGIDRAELLDGQVRGVDALVRQQERVRAGIAQRGGPPTQLRRALETMVSWETRRHIVAVERLYEPRLAGPAKPL